LFLFFSNKCIRKSPPNFVIESRKVRLHLLFASEKSCPKKNSCIWTAQSKLKFGLWEISRPSLSKRVTSRFFCLNYWYWDCIEKSWPLNFSKFKEKPCPSWILINFFKLIFFSYEKIKFGSFFTLGNGLGWGHYQKKGLTAWCKPFFRQCLQHQGRMLLIGVHMKPTHLFFSFLFFVVACVCVYELLSF
jgi:hypothetical protein